MSWKEMLKKLCCQMTAVETMLRVLQGQVAVNSKRMAALRTMIETSEKNKGQSVDRMADRLIEMAMVDKGMGRSAAIHRRSLQDEVPSEQQDLWQESPEEEWPPKGFDAINLP